MTTEIFLDNLNRYILGKGISRNTFAEAIGVHQTTVSSWYKRKTIPSGDVIDKISKYFEIEPSELFIRDMAKTISNAFSTNTPLPFDDKYLARLGFDIISNEYVQPLGRVLPGIPYEILDQLRALGLNSESDKTVLTIGILLQYFTQEKGLKTRFDTEYTDEYEDDKLEIELRKKQLLRIASEINNANSDLKAINFYQKLRYLNELEINLIETSIDAIIEEKERKKREKKSVS